MSVSVAVGQVGKGDQEKKNPSMCSTMALKVYFRSSTPSFLREERQFTKYSKRKNSERL